MALFTYDDLDEARELVGTHVPVTPAYAWPLLAAEVGQTVWVKHENATPTGAFKVRGGLVYVDAVRQAGELTGVVSATRGNHGQSLAYAARAAGTRATIVVPEGNSPAKNAAMVAFGAELVVKGHDFQAAREYAADLAEERGLTMVPPFDPLLVRGVATYALEFFGQAGPLRAVYVPVGMGSGVVALATVREILGFDTEIVGVVAERAPATALSLAAGHAIPTQSADTFVDGVACRQPVPEAIRAMIAGGVRVVTVSEDMAADAMRQMWRTTRVMPEPAGALGLAGLVADARRPDGPVGVVLTGGNCDDATALTVLSGGTPAPS